MSEGQINSTRRSLLGGVRFGSAVAILGAAGYFAVFDAWPWPRPAASEPVVAIEEATPVAPVIHEIVDTLRRGETLSELFHRQGVRNFSLPGLPTRVSLDPRRLRAGLVFSFQRELGESMPSRILVRATPEERVTFERVAEGWSARSDSIAWRAEPLRLEGPIDASLYEALDAEIPDSVLDLSERMKLAWDLADIYAWQVDFTRDIRPGDQFRVIVERMVSEEGEIRFGRVMASDLIVGGNTLTAYLFEAGDGTRGFYDARGVSLRRAFLRAPVQFRRISSRFSSGRKHPVLGTIRRHQGTDYAADPGTPVMAAGNGVVLSAGRAGGYGNMIELRHANGITTRYAHLRGFAKGIRAGTRVSQGDIIGYVGSTGLSTGPHLHYEFRVNGTARDPRRTDLGNGEPIPAAEREAFESERLRYQLMLATPAAAPPVAAR